MIEQTSGVDVSQQCRRHTQEGNMRELSLSDPLGLYPRDVYERDILVDLEEGSGRINNIGRLTPGERTE